MEITIEQLGRVLDNKLEPITAKLDTIQETVASHTDTLDMLVKQTKDWNVEMTVMRNRMERYENALKVVAKKLDLDLHSLLN